MWFGFGDASTNEMPLSKELYEELPPPSGEMGSLRSGRGGDDRFNSRWNDLILGLGAVIITLYLLTYIHPSVLIRPASSTTTVSSQTDGKLSKHRPKIHFITYGSSTPCALIIALFFILASYSCTTGDGQYEHSKDRLKYEALHTGWFETVDAWDSRNLTIPFKKKFDAILKMDQRGGGYWIWKFDIIKTIMSRFDKGDYIVYVDSGCEIDERNEKRFYEYVDALRASNFSFLGFPVAGM